MVSEMLYNRFSMVVDENRIDFSQDIWLESSLRCYVKRWFFLHFLGLAESWQNVALHTNGSTCTASSSDVGQPCLRAIDGLLWYNRAWVSRSAGVGIWIEVWTILWPIKNGYADGSPSPTEIYCVYIMDKLLHHWISEGSNTNQVPTFCRSHSKICKYKPWFCEMLFIIYCETPQQIFTNSFSLMKFTSLAPIET